MTDEKDKKVVPINKKELEKEGANTNKRIAKKIEKELDEALREHVGLPPDNVEELDDDFDVDDYDDVCKDCRAEEDDEFPEEWIRSPVKEHEDFPMVLMRSSNYWYIGAWLCPPENGEGSILGYPLTIAEMMDNSVSGHPQVSLMLNKMFYSLGMHERMMVRYDVMIFLESSRQKDRELVRIYGNAIEKLSVESAGLVPATPQDIFNINSRGPFKS